MFSIALPPLYGLGAARRIKPLAHPGDRVTSGELGLLLLAGTLATVAVAAFHPALRIPGHVILRATLPIVGGMALVPRRFVGSIMALGAGGAALCFSAAGFDSWQPAAVVSLLALGPAIDLALAGPVAADWRVYLRFALAGILANSLSFAVRFATAQSPLDDSHPHRMSQFGVGAFFSFAACGAIAGLISAAVCFGSTRGTRRNGDEPVI